MQKITPTEPNDQGEWKCPVCLQITKTAICHCGLLGPSLFRDNVTSFIVVPNGYKRTENVENSDERKTKIRKTSGRRPCQYGARCYRKNPIHKQEFSHPGDPDYPNQTPVSVPLLFGGNILLRNININNNGNNNISEEPTDDSDSYDSDSDGTRSYDSDNSNVNVEEEDNSEEDDDEEINAYPLQPLLYGGFSKLISKYLDINSVIRLISTCSKAKDSYDNDEIWKSVYYNYLPTTTVDVYYDKLHDDLNTFKIMIKFLNRNIKRDKQLPEYIESDRNAIKKYKKISKHKMKELNKTKYILIGGLKKDDAMEIENESDDDNEDSADENEKYNLNTLLQKYHNKYKDFEYLDGGCYGDNDLNISKTLSNNITELLEWFPKLKYLYLKNGEEQSIMESNHEYPNLLYFGIESCGICKELLNGILLCKYANLIELELWLGCEERGNDIDIKDLNPLLNENDQYFPELKILRIRNSEKLNEIMKEILKSKIIKELKMIDLSYGIIKDEMFEDLLKLLEFDNIKCVIIHKHMIKSDRIEELKNKYKEKNVTLIEDTIRKFGDDDGCKDSGAFNE